MRWLAALCLFVVLGCGNSTSTGEDRECNDGGSPPTLAGSYCEDISMLYREVKCLTVSDALRVEYVRPVGTGSEKTVQIIVSSANVVLEPNHEIKLREVGGEVRRILAEGNLSLTEELENTSSLTFTKYDGMLGNEVVGSFALLFTSGRTLRGDFTCTLQDARPTGM